VLAATKPVASIDEASLVALHAIRHSRATSSRRAGGARTAAINVRLVAVRDLIIASRRTIHDGGGSIA
jgi:hypothetical protein